MEKFVKFSEVRVGDTFVTKKYGDDYRFIKVLRRNGKPGAILANSAVPYKTTIFGTHIPAFSDCSDWACCIIKAYADLDEEQRHSLSMYNLYLETPKNEKPVTAEYHSDKIPVIINIEDTNYSHAIINISPETAKCLQYLMDMDVLDRDCITIAPPTQTF